MSDWDILQQDNLSDAQRQQIRDRLISASQHQRVVYKDDNNKGIGAIKHTKEVPFEGNVYYGLNRILDSKHINQKYEKSLMSIWSIIAWSLLKPLFKITYKAK